MDQTQTVRSGRAGIWAAIDSILVMAVGAAQSKEKSPKEGAGGSFAGLMNHE
jgi:hypothetical protein